jgi:biotin synthase-like enzyme
MNEKITKLAQQITDGGFIGRDDIEFLFSLGDDSLEDLMYWANRIREKFFGKKKKSAP